MQNTKRVRKEITVLRSVSKNLQALSEGADRAPTYGPNPRNDKHICFSTPALPINKIGAFLEESHVELEKAQLGTMLDNVMLRPVTYRSADDVRKWSLTKKAYVNFFVCDYTRDAIATATKSAMPDSENYPLPLLIEILDKLEADVESLEFENNCEEETPKPRRKPVRAPLFSAEQALAVMSQLGLGDGAQKVAAALGIVPAKTEEPDAEG